MSVDDALRQIDTWLRGHPDFSTAEWVEEIHLVRLVPLLVAVARAASVAIEEVTAALVDEFGGTASWVRNDFPTVAAALDALAAVERYANEHLPEGN